MTRHLLGAGAASLFLLATVGSANADGLSRFEQLTKGKIPNGALTYKSAKALGDSGFVLEDVVVTPPPDKGTKTEPIKIKRLSVDDLDFNSIEKQAPPNFAKVKVEGIAITDKPAEGVDLKQLAGMDGMTVDMALDYRLEPERKTMTLNKLELAVNGVARIELAMILDDVSMDMAANPDAAMDKASLRTATLTYDDQSLLATVVPVVAKLQGSDAAAMVTLATTTLSGLRNGQSSATQAALDAVSSYVQDYQKPKGPLKVTLNPPNKASMAAINNAKTPDEAVKALGLVVSYAGTKPGAPAPGGSASGGGGDSKASCTNGTRFFVNRDDVWWSATARDSSKSGKDCIARIEGADDDVVVPMEKTLAWSIDGPGKALDKCASGTKVVVLDKGDGGWYPGKVSDKPFAAGQCPIKYDNPDNDDETVPMKRVRRLD